jgi:phage terminase large subunit GpA-like protein
MAYQSTPEALSELQAAIDRARAIFTPPPDLTVSAWADQNRVLSSLDSATPGRWQTSSAEYLRGVMDSYNDADVEDVTFEASAQVGKTQGGLNNILGYIIDQNPGPVMVVQPTQQDAKEWSKDRFMDGLIGATPCLKGKIKAVRSKSSKDTIEHKRFSGGQLTVAWSKSPSRLAGRPIRDVFFDEVDKYDIKPGVQGNAVDRGKARTKTFFNGKHFHFSTPTLGSLKAEAGDGELSLIDRLYRQSDMRRFNVPCPGCGKAGVIAFWADMEHPAVRGAQFHVEWDKAKDGTPLPDTAHLICHECGLIISEAERQTMIPAGVWKASRPGGNHAGFHISALYSTLGGNSLARIVKQFLEARKDLDALQNFYNETLGLPFELQGDTLADDTLAKRCEKYPAEAPVGVLAVTAGVDVQHDRLEVGFFGWGVGWQNWSLRKVVIYGDTSTLYGREGAPSVWEQLDQLLATRFEHESGISLPVICTFVDSSDQTQVVYQYCADKWRRGIFACKGDDGIKPIVSQPKALRGGARFVIVGADTAKETIYGWLKIDKVGSGFCHFPQRAEFDAEHFKQLAAEKMITENKQSRPRKRWIRIRKRNEALDLFVYALAAMEFRKPSWKSMCENLERRAAEIAKPAEPDSEKVEVQSVESAHKPAAVAVPQAPVLPVQAPAPAPTVRPVQRPQTPERPRPRIVRNPFLGSW